MPLPLLPGLSKQAPVDDDDTIAPEDESGNPLADFLNGLDDSQVQELVADADAYVAVNPEEPGEGAEGDTLPSPPLEEGEEAADTETDLEPPEPGEEGDVEPDAQDLEAISTTAASDAEQASAMLAELDEMSNGESVNAPIIGNLLKNASKLNDQLLKNQKAVDKAIASEDTQAAAQAGINCRLALEAIDALTDAARRMSTAVEAPAATPQDHPALKAWAAQVQGKPLPAL